MWYLWSWRDLRRRSQRRLWLAEQAGDYAALTFQPPPRRHRYRALPSSPFETLALSSAAELVGVARPRCGGSVTRESDISNGENGDISIGRLKPASRSA